MFLHLNLQVDSPLFAAVLLLLQPIYFRGGRPSLPAWEFKLHFQASFKTLCYYRNSVWRLTSLGTWLQHTVWRSVQAAPGQWWRPVQHSASSPPHWHAHPAKCAETSCRYSAQPGSPSNPSTLLSSSKSVSGVRTSDQEIRIVCFYVILAGVPGVAWVNKVTMSRKTLQPNSTEAFHVLVSERHSLITPGIVSACSH